MPRQWIIRPPYQAKWDINGTCTVQELTPLICKQARGMLWCSHVLESIPIMTRSAINDSLHCCSLLFHNINSQFCTHILHLEWDKFPNMEHSSIDCAINVWLVHSLNRLWRKAICHCWCVINGRNMRRKLHIVGVYTIKTRSNFIWVKKKMM